MKELVNKLIEIEKRTALERGKYNLFALFLREDSFNKWDILVSADWIIKDKGEALKYLASIIQKYVVERRTFTHSRNCYY